MTSLPTLFRCTALLGIAVLSSCHRPVAYFQKVAHASPATEQMIAQTPVAQAAESLIESLPPVSAVPISADTYARNERTLVVNKKLSERMGRIKHLLASTPDNQMSTASGNSRKMNVVERMVIRRMNKRIGQQLAPHHPEKAMIAHRIPLIGGAVLLIGGLILLIAGTGTVAFIGLILSLVGALGVIVGLFGG